MYYLIKETNVGELDDVTKKLVDFSWDSELIRVAPYDSGILVDFGEDLGEAAGRLSNRLGKSIEPVPVVRGETKWQVAFRNMTLDD